MTDALPRENTPDVTELMNTASAAAQAADKGSMPHSQDSCGGTEITGVHPEPFNHCHALVLQMQCQSVAQSKMH